MWKFFMAVEIESSRKGFVLRSEFELDHPIEEVFPFFAEAENLTRITPPFLSFNIESVSDKEMKEGLNIVYKIRLHGVPIRWKSLISQWDPPHSFVDEQLSGPYQRWHHLHTFEAKGDGTIIKDEVNYSVFGGRVIHSLFVKPDLLKIFRFRQKELERIFPSGA
jgi:ligand-binding SRPBCC domain-containing protein